MVAKDHGTLSLTLLYSLAGVEGFEPPHDGTRTRCLTTWRHPIATEYCSTGRGGFQAVCVETTWLYRIAHSPSFLSFILSLR